MQASKKIVWILLLFTLHLQAVVGQGGCHLSLTVQCDDSSELSISKIGIYPGLYKRALTANTVVLQADFLLPNDASPEDGYWVPEIGRTHIVNQLIDNPFKFLLSDQIVNLENNVCSLPTLYLGIDAVSIPSSAELIRFSVRFPSGRIIEIKVPESFQLTQMPDKSIVAEGIP